MLQQPQVFCLSASIVIWAPALLIWSKCRSKSQELMSTTFGFCQWLTSMLYLRWSTCKVGIIYVPHRSSEDELFRVQFKFQFAEDAEHFAGNQTLKSVQGFELVEHSISLLNISTSYFFFLLCLSSPLTHSEQKKGLFFSQSKHTFPIAFSSMTFLLNHYWYHFVIILVMITV